MGSMFFSGQCSKNSHFCMCGTISYIRRSSRCHFWVRIFLNMFPTSFILKWFISDPSGRTFRYRGNKFKLIDYFSSWVSLRLWLRILFVWSVWFNRHWYTKYKKSYHWIDSEIKLCFLFFVFYRRSETHKD